MFYGFSPRIDAFIWLEARYLALNIIETVIESYEHYKYQQ